ncbi:MAG: putative glycylpeptide N-tetradecanoyltransferase 2 [Terrestrivirus sp.]|uniref:glycylpeptide N-tetradecanoyltransferase n=1 Tax=Terrestrivirus sp. TaxID=2487775 RepID=A0A3G4ZMF5_9VIRU|nr:MAG: putative glycylpeptide N-tetradecanoyltransferase 2 [Terrestrivirus sp.]
MQSINIEVDIKNKVNNIIDGSTILPCASYIFGILGLIYDHICQDQMILLKNIVFKRMMSVNTNINKVVNFDLDFTNESITISNDEKKYFSTDYALLEPEILVSSEFSELMTNSLTTINSFSTTSFEISRTTIDHNNNYISNFITNCKISPNNQEKNKYIKTTIKGNELSIDIVLQICFTLMSEYINHLNESNGMHIYTPYKISEFLFTGIGSLSKKNIYHMYSEIIDTNVYRLYLCNDRGELVLSLNNCLVTKISSGKIKKTNPVDKLELCAPGINEIANFVDEYYYSAPEQKFQPDYTKQFIEWYLSRSTYWTVGIKLSDKLLGVICAVKSSIQIKSDTIENSAEILLLCVHPSYRKNVLNPDGKNKQNLSDLLINSIAKLLQKDGIQEVIYTRTSISDDLIPLASTPYYHKLINIDKLADYGFCSTDKTQQGFVELTKLTNLELFIVNDESMQQLYSLYLNNSNNSDNIIKHIMSYDEFCYTFNSPFVTIYVIKSDNNITDFVSIYNLNRKIRNIPNQSIKEGYLYYSSINTVEERDVINDLIIIMRLDSYDLFTLLSTSLTDVNEVIDVSEFVGLVNGSIDTQYYLIFNNYLQTNKIKYIVP